MATKRFPRVNFGAYTQQGLTKHLTPSMTPGQLSFARGHGYNFGSPAPPATLFAPTQSNAGNVGNQQMNIPQSDPRDAQYFNDVAKLDQYYQSNKAGLLSGQQQLTRQLATNKAALQEQQPKDELTAKQSANKAGLFYSGALGKNLGDIAESYAKRRSDLQTSYEADQGKISQQLQDLESNYGPSGLMRNDALLSGIGRAEASDVDNASSIAAQMAATQPAASASVPFTTQAGVSKAGVPGTWHIYPGGRKVFVARR